MSAAPRTSLFATWLLPQCLFSTEERDVRTWRNPKRELQLGRIENDFQNHMRRSSAFIASLSDLPANVHGTLDCFELSKSVSEHLMNLGFVPGLEVSVVGSGPGGDPRIYRVDGSEVALRNDVSRGIMVRIAAAKGAVR
jgi:ferrous iron transport protein A